MSIGQFCNRDTAIIRREDSIVEAAKRMRQGHVGCLVVVEDDPRGVKPVGIITDRDLVVEILAAELDPGAVTIGDIISGELLTAREQDGLWETLRRMSNKGIRRMPVNDAEGYLAGIITFDDLLEILVGELGDLVRISDHERARECTNRSE